LLSVRYWLQKGRRSVLTLSVISVKMERRKRVQYWHTKKCRVQNQLPWKEHMHFCVRQVTLDLVNILARTVTTVISRSSLWWNPRKRTQEVTSLEIMVAKMSTSAPYPTFRQLIIEKCCHGQVRMELCPHPVARANGQGSPPEPTMNCSHRFRLTKTKPTESFLLLRRHFNSKDGGSACKGQYVNYFTWPWNLKCLTTCAKLFRCCNCSGSLNIANCNRAIRFETRWK
jgi:hypothetical protein